MNNIKVFSAMLDAVAYVLGEQAKNYFTMTDHRGWGAACIESLDTIDDRDVADTFVEFAADIGRVAAVSLDSEMHYGFVFAHYTDDGEIVRFVAIRQH